MVCQKMRRWISWWIVAGSLLATLGCNSGSNNSMVGAGGSKSKAAGTDTAEDEVPGPQTEPPLTQPADSATPVDAASVTVQVVDRAGFDKALAQHRGKVVLVDYWATWCGPCRKKFPHTVALANEHKAEGLAVISVAMDDDEAHEEVVKFLAEHGATFDNLRSKTGAGDESFESFEIPNGALPCLRLFDRDGQLLKTFAIDPDADQQFSDDDVAEAVKAALAKP